MARESADRQRLAPGPPPRVPPALDEIDLRLVELMMADGRMTNVELARRVGIAESTCISRLRSLRERGVITGIHAEVDLAQLGLPLTAMVAVRFAGHARADVEDFGREVAELPGVLATYNISGANDFLVHLAAADTESLRNVVLDNITGRPSVVHVETSLIFASTRGSVIAPT